MGDVLARNRPYGIREDFEVKSLQGHDSSFLEPNIYLTKFPLINVNCTC